MFSASGRFAWPALVNKLSRVCFAARCSEQLRLAGCFLPFSLILLSVNAGQFWWVRLGSRWRRAKVDCRAAEVMKSSAVFIHCLVIRPPQPPRRGRGHSHTDSHKHAHTVQLEGKEENVGHRQTTSHSLQKVCVDSSQTHGALSRLSGHGQASS